MCAPISVTATGALTAAKAVLISQILGVCTIAGLLGFNFRDTLFRIAKKVK